MTLPEISTKTIGILTFLVGSGIALVASAETVHFGTLASFSGPDDLDLAGTFAYAVDFPGGGGTVKGLAFTGETAPGVSITAERTADPWSPKPEYGADADSNALEDVMLGIRYSLWQDPAPNTISINLTVEDGQPYKLQLLWSENYWPNSGRRFFDVVVDGQLAIDELDVNAVQGDPPGTASAPRSSPATKGAVYTHTLTASGTTLNITLSHGSTAGGDFNEIINGLTLEEVPEPASLILLAVGSLAVFGLGGVRRRRAR